MAADEGSELVVVAHVGAATPLSGVAQVVQHTTAPVTNTVNTTVTEPHTRSAIQQVRASNAARCTASAIRDEYCRTRGACSGTGISNGAPTNGSGSSTVLPQTGHPTPTRANLWSLSTILPLIAAMLLVLTGCALRRRAVRLG